MEKDNWYEYYVKELEDSKYRFIELNENNIDDIKFEDVAFYSEAELGAMGEHGGVEIVTKDLKFYHTNIAEQFSVFEKLTDNNLKEFGKVRIALGTASNVPEGFKFYNLGFGNSLFVKQKFVNNFEKMLEKLQKSSEIYAKWKDFALKILNDYKKTTPKICLGFDKNNNEIECYLKDVGNILVTGFVGSGKTVFLNNVLKSLFDKNNQEYFDVDLVDTKQIEFQEYYGAYKAVKKIISREEDILKELENLKKESEERYELMSESRVRNIEEYNVANPFHMKYKIVVIDELVDYLYNDEIVFYIRNALSKFRAAGIYLVIATQRPDLLAEKGLSNLFMTTIVLQNEGYEKYFDFLKNSKLKIKNIKEMIVKSSLFGNITLKLRNEMTYKNKGEYLLHEKSIRDMTEKDYKKVLKLPDSKFVSDKEREMKVSEIFHIDKTEVSEEKLPITDKEVEHILKEVANQEGLAQLKNDLKQYDKISGSLLQRYLRIGFSAAHKILDYLVQNGAIEKSNGTAKPRQILDKEKIIKALS